MKLASALTFHESALRASLQAEYGLRLLINGGGRTEPHRSPCELADYIEHLPGGCALTRAFGGEAALSAEGALMREVEFGVRAISYQLGGAQGKQPVRLELPPPAHEQRAEAEAMAAKERAWQERQTRRNAQSAGG